MPRSRNRCRIVWRKNGEIVHETVTDTKSATLYRRWVRDNVLGFGEYDLEILPVTSGSEEEAT